MEEFKIFPSRNKIVSEKMSNLAYGNFVVIRGCTFKEEKALCNVKHIFLVCEAHILFFPPDFRLY